MRTKAAPNPDQSREPRSEETLRKFYDGETNKLTNRELGLQFVAEIMHIRRMATERGEYADEVLLMINQSLGYRDWLDIPWGKLDDCKKIVQNYPDDERYRIFDPVLYAAIQRERPRLEAACQQTGKSAYAIVNEVAQATLGTMKAIP